MRCLLSFVLLVCFSAAAWAQAQSPQEDAPGRESVAQDWPAWIKAGWLDFVCPMDYTESDTGFCGLVENQLELVGGRIPVYPGIGATASRVRLSADRVAGQIHHARRLGAAGFTIFNLSESTAADILPGLRLGATSKAARPTHTSGAVKE